MKLQDKLLQLKKDKKAILAANFYNFETLLGIVRAAAGLKMPLILQLSESSIRYMGLRTATAMAKTTLTDYSVEGWIHLDHGISIEIVQACLDAGFDSVMIDASEKSLEENISITAKVTKLASGYDANVEAELGYIAKLGQGYNRKGFTQPADAIRFSENTGINALAVSIGSAHGFYKDPPDLDIKLLSEISNSVGIPLVLHGSSGIPDQMLIEAVQNGICKVNLATETKNIFMRTLQHKLKDTDEIDLRLVFPDAINAVKDLIRMKLLILQEA